MVRRYISVVSIRSLTGPFCPISGYRGARGAVRGGRASRPCVEAVLRGCASRLVVEVGAAIPERGEMSSSVMWFRRDLRLGDNPALLEACADGSVLPLFLLDPALWGPA